jgi:hypothetical protein
MIHEEWNLWLHSNSERVFKSMSSKQIEHVTASGGGGGGGITGISGTLFSSILELVDCVCVWSWI